MADRPLEDVRIEFEKLAQELTEHTKKVPVCAAFPRGYIRRLDDIRPRWPYLSPERQRTVACIIQLCDVNRWHLNTWSLGLTAGSVWEWHSTLPVIAVIETLLYEFSLQQGLVRDGAKFHKVIDTLNSKGVYKQALRDKLHELREYRNEVHLYLKGEVEMHDGKPKRYNEAVKTLHEVEEHVNAFLSAKP